MNCPCDELIFPPDLDIPAGLTALRRQIATFPEFRAAMLAAIPTKGALVMWRARSNYDFGVMLLEMWAYVCDSISFYDQVRADEFYDRTAQLRSSVRMLTNLLGYTPRPAVAAMADLAVLVEGRQPVLLPAGTAFRSGAFPGSAPQVFELGEPTKAHPFDNQWTIAQNRPVSIGGGSLTYLLVEAKTSKLKKGSYFVFEVVGTSAYTTARTVTAVSDFKAPDGITYKKIEWSGAAIAAPANTPVANVRLTIPTRAAHLTTKTTTNGLDPITAFLGSTLIVCNTIYNGLGTDSRMVLEKNGEARYFTTVLTVILKLQLTPDTSTKVTDAGGTVISVVNSPGATADATVLALDVDINTPGRKPAGAANWTKDDAAAITIHFEFIEAATVASPALTTLSAGDPLLLLPPVETPQDGKSPGQFQLEDKNGLGLAATGQVHFTTRTLSLDATAPITNPLVTPVAVYGNIVHTVRGETVPMELLGVGDAIVLNQQFKLKKGPLTYTSAQTESGVATSLIVYVDGVMWTEAVSFFGVKEHDQIYIVRQNDDGDSIVTFNGRLSTGSVITASYRFGGGAATPPSGSIKQLAVPAPGLKSVRNPVAAYGGADAEPSSQIRTLAPRSALLLGRAISVPDMQAAAFAAPGARAASAEWNWSEVAQSAVVHIYYIGSAALKTAVISRVRGLADPTVPIRVDQATPIPVDLSIGIEIDPKHRENDVLNAVRTALLDPMSGLLPPERVGIGQAVFRSQIFETILAIPGALAVNGLFWNGAPFSDWGKSPGAGNYFDFETGTLLLNGKADGNG
jgi:hypothetical protein